MGSLTHSLTHPPTHRRHSSQLPVRVHSEISSTFDTDLVATGCGRSNYSTASFISRHRHFTAQGRGGAGRGALVDDWMIASEVVDAIAGGMEYPGVL